MNTIVTLLAVLVGLNVLLLFVLLVISLKLSRLLTYMEQAGPRDLGSPMSVPSQSSEVPSEIARALRSGDKLLAIKLYKEARDCSLLEAKQAVDAMSRVQGFE